jgi:hypothetical protein
MFSLSEQPCYPRGVLLHPSDSGWHIGSIVLPAACCMRHLLHPAMHL